MHIQGDSMKTEEQIKERIRNLTTEGSLPSFIAAIMLLWVIDAEEGILDSYTEKLGDVLNEVGAYVNSMP